ncbi:MAG TPA: c-type cytochrome domain-containing protein, partial [Chryseolinea sp.]
RCYSCHSASKQKGKLRLDGKNFIEKGGESGHIIEAGVADSSAMFSRLMLSLEDEDHMPPNEKPQPSSSEIALIQAWINEGADFEMKVSECKSAEKVKGYFISVVDQSHKEKLTPDEVVDPADAALVAALAKNGIIVLPVSKQSNYLSVSFVNKRSVAVEDLRALLPLKKQIIWLDLSRTTVSDMEIADIAQLTTLRRLNLEFTALSDAGLQPIASLPNLSYLNLVGTKITDKGLMQLSGLKNLQDLFVYQTSVTNAGIKSYLALAPKISIDSGRYHLPKLLTDSVVTKYNP